MQNDKKLSTYLMILLSISMLTLFTKGAYSDLQLKISEKKAFASEEGNMSIQLAVAEEKKLREIKEDMSAPNSDIRAEIDKYTVPFTEDELLLYFYGYASGTSGEFYVNSLTLDTRNTNEYGFKEGVINLNVSVTDENAVMSFLTDIMSEGAKYKFFIEKINIPERQKDKGMELTIPLKIFYK